jgi:hypothetical protein
MESIGVKSSILTFYVGKCLSQKEIQMMKIYKSVITVLAITVLFMGLSGCKQQGPAERAGKKIDEAVEKGGQQVEKAGKKIQEDAKGK